MTVEYLIRFDDICETMNWSIWKQVEDLLRKYQVRPILVVIPDNQDETLCHAPENDRFWQNVYTWQTEDNWTIGLHGYQHRYTTNDGGILRLSHKSEFAGLSYELQKEKITEALNIFRKHRIIPETWIAPSHSFDTITMNVLRESGIFDISDGYALHPYLDEQGMFWMPQQLWRFRKLPLGTWTVCYHINHWKNKDLKIFEQALVRYQRNIISYDEAKKRYAGRTLNIFDRLFHKLWVRLLALKSL